MQPLATTVWQRVRHAAQKKAGMDSLATPARSRQTNWRDLESTIAWLATVTCPDPSPSHAPYHLSRIGLITGKLSRLHMALRVLAFLAEATLTSTDDGRLRAIGT